MGTYWGDFIKLYQDRIYHVGMARVLEAFWYYCNRFQKEEYMEECNKIMHR